MTVPPDSTARRTLNQRVRRLGVGATVELEYSPSRRGYPDLGTVLARGETPDWRSTEVGPDECCVVLDVGEDRNAVLVGYDRSNETALPHLYRADKPGVGVWELRVVDRGIQLAASCAAADLFDEVGRFGGR